jgi:hypothetical protein
MVSETVIQRFGRVTCSNFHKIIGEGKGRPFSAPAYTYFEELAMERVIKEPIEKDSSNSNFAWGRVCELYVNDKYLFGWEFLHDVSKLHPSGHYSGRPDVTKDDEITGDIKCPVTSKSFISQLQCIVVMNKKGDVGREMFKERHADYYWQIVSGAELRGHKKGALILFMPTNGLIPDIIDYITNLDESKFKSPDEYLQMKNDTYGISIANHNRLSSCSLGGIYFGYFDIPEEDLETVRFRAKLADAEIERRAEIIKENLSI